ncbi:MAG TPA: type II toxin-antitoxin system RelE/ParE family toxin [Burkholderiales bacterium]|nr:type II toxin-antitoxin system RelE/ParE family toxin [Burkholderiales bacterium]
MAAATYSARALADLDRLFDFLVAENPNAAAAAAAVIVDAVTILERHPYIGRPVRGRLRELVISYGRTGYVALYRVAARGDRVEILAIRHQREAGYRS